VTAMKVPVGNVDLQRDHVHIDLVLFKAKQNVHNGSVSIL